MRRGEGAPEPLTGSVGVACYIGAPGAGKTAACQQDAEATADALGWPLVVVDSLATMKAGRLEDKADDATLKRLVTMAVAGRKGFRWCPRSKDGAVALNRVLRALAESRAGHVVLVDEWSLWINARARRVPELLLAARTWRHAKLRLLLTTQHPADVPPELVSCCPRVHLFRVLGPRALLAAEKLGFNPEEVGRLKPFEHFVLEPGQEPSYREPRRLRARAKVKDPCARS